VAFVDVRTGESWVVAGEEWNAWISWSYGDVAVLRVERGTAGPDLELLACHAVNRTCDRLSNSGGILSTELLTVKEGRSVDNTLPGDNPHG